MQGASPLRKEGFDGDEVSWKSHMKDPPVLLPSATQSLRGEGRPQGQSRTQNWSGKGRGTASELESAQAGGQCLRRADE